MTVFFHVECAGYAELWTRPACVAVSGHISKARGSRVQVDELTVRYQNCGSLG